MLREESTDPTVKALIDASRAGPGRADNLAVLGDLLQERGEPLGLAIASVSADPHLTYLGIETFGCWNDLEGQRSFDVPVFRYEPFATALGISPGERRLDTELVLLPPLTHDGRVLMGSPPGEFMRFHNEAGHWVRIARPFLLARAAVTHRLFVALGGTAPVLHDPRPMQPAGPIAWDDAAAWCATVGVRLPSEAEWEFACRAGTQTPYCFGSAIDAKQANTGGQRERRLGGKPEWDGLVPVGSLPHNAFGLYEMHGNIDEWVQDTFADYALTATDGSAHEDPRHAARRVRRGGNLGDFAFPCRSADRHDDGYYHYTFAPPVAGLRVARCPML